MSTEKASPSRMVPTAFHFDSRYRTDVIARLISFTRTDVVHLSRHFHQSLRSRLLGTMDASPATKKQKLMGTPSADEPAAAPATGPTLTQPASDLPTYLLLALRGLEFLVVEEIREKLQVEYLEVCSVEKDPKYPNINIYQGEAAVGRILLQTRSSAEQVRSLQSVQAVLALVARSNEVVTDDEKALGQISRMVVDADWKLPMQLWKEHMHLNFPDRAPDDPVYQTPSFRGSCVRDGRHAYKSVTIAADIGAAIVETFKWKVDLTKFDLEVVCILFYQYMVVGISLANPHKIQFRNRMAPEDRSLMADTKYVSTLRPSTTYLLLKLAQYEAGDILLDSMCGVGTIPIWSAEFAKNQVFALGGELDSLPVEKAGQNAASGSRYAEICQWDSTNLPLRSDIVDRVVIDLPFGVSCGNPRQLSKIYPRIIKELYRVMRPGARAVLLTSLKKTILHSIPLVPWRLVASHEVNIGGLLSCVYVIEK